MTRTYDPADPVDIAAFRDEIFGVMLKSFALCTEAKRPVETLANGLLTLHVLHNAACNQLQSAHMPPTISIREDVLIGLKSDLQAMIDDGSLDGGDNLAISASWVDRLQHILDTKGGKK